MHFASIYMLHKAPWESLFWPKFDLFWPHLAVFWVRKASKTARYTHQIQTKSILDPFGRLLAPKTPENRRVTSPNPGKNGSNSTELGPLGSAWGTLVTPKGENILPFDRKYPLLGGESTPGRPKMRPNYPPKLPP